MPTNKRTKAPSKKTLPKVDLGDLSVTRLILGGNPISGFSHHNEEMDMEMRRYFTTPRIHKLLSDCEKNGIDSVIARADNHVMRAFMEYFDKGGQIQWIAQTAAERTSVENNVQTAKKFGAKAAFLHGGTTRQLWEAKDYGKMKDLIAYIQDQGLPAGIASHDPEVFQMADDQEFAADFYMVCLYNPTARMVPNLVNRDQLFVEEDREKALSLIPHLSRPVIAYKVLAGGRRDPETSLKEVYSRIKEGDAVLLGMYPGWNPRMARDNADLVRKILS
jgi:hypothetical protein